MKINLVGKNSKGLSQSPDDINQGIDEAISAGEKPPGLEIAFETLIPKGTQISYELSAGKFIWETYKAPDGSKPPSDEQIWAEYSRQYIRWKTKTETHQLFSTPLVSTFPLIDIEKIKEDCLSLAEKNLQVEISNLGGYQGHDFNNEELNEAIKAAIPPIKVNSKYDFEVDRIYSWVNINGKGHSNSIHNHKDLMENTLWSGVFYVQVPDKSGDIVFLSPHAEMADSNDYLYNDGPNNYYSITPKPGQMLLFPSWLMHHVTANESDEERISIAFNLMGNLLVNS